MEEGEEGIWEKKGGRGGGLKKGGEWGSMQVGPRGLWARPASCCPYGPAFPATSWVLLKWTGGKASY